MSVSFNETVRRLRIDATTTGVDPATTSLNNLSDAQQRVAQSGGVMAQVTDTSAKRALSADKDMRRLTLTIDEQARANDNIAKATRTLDSAMSQGIIKTQGDYDKKLAQINDRYSLSIRANTAYAQSFTFLTAQAGAFASGLGPIGGLIASLGPAGLLAAGAVGALFTVLKKDGADSEKLLQEHDRLLGVVKNSYDSVTESASKWLQQSRDATRLQLLQQEIDLREKLAQATVKGLKNTVELPFGAGLDQVRIKDQYKEFSDAIFTLNEGWQRGTPNVRAFVDEISRIALLNPTLQKLGVELTNSVGDASKFAYSLQQVKDTLKLIEGGKLSTDERGRLGIPDAVKAQSNSYDQLIERTKDRIDELNLEAETAGRVTDAVLKMRLQHDAERAAKKAGVSVNQEVLTQLKEEIALASRRATIANVRSDIDFDRRTLGFSAEDIQIAQRLRVLYGNEIPTALESSEAAAIRFNNAFRQADDLGRAAFAGLFENLRKSETVMASVTSTFAEISTTLCSPPKREAA